MNQSDALKELSLLLFQAPVHQKGHQDTLYSYVQPRDLDSLLLLEIFYPCTSEWRLKYALART